MLQPKMKPPGNRACRTCQRRHVRCSRERPTCQACHKRSVPCEGYDDQPRSNHPVAHSRQTLPRQVTLGHAVEIVTQFLQILMPAHNLIRGTVSDWFTNLPVYMGDSAMFDAAAEAYGMVYLGAKEGNILWIENSLMRYTQVLKMVCTMNRRLSPRQEDELLRTAMTMGFYEFLNPSNGPSAWPIHVQVARRVLEGRGPPTAERPLQLSLYRPLRLFIWAEACILRRQRLFLNEPKWHLAPSTGELFDEIRDILFALPGVLEHCDNVYAMTSITPNTVRTLEDLFRESKDLEARLLDWYSRLQAAKDPLYLIHETAANSPLREGDPRLCSLFPGMVDFPTESVMEMLLVYWFGSLMLYTNMINVYEKMEYLKTTRIHENNDDENIAFVFSEEPPIEVFDGMEQVAAWHARLTCQAVSVCLEPRRGVLSLQMLLSPLWAAKDYYRTRNKECYEWCNQVFVQISQKGYGFGQVAANMPPGKNRRAP
ncbi:hypothetical protein AWENTII_009276 [Aspergillus wentii]